MPRDRLTLAAPLGVENRVELRARSEGLDTTDELMELCSKHYELGQTLIARSVELRDKSGQMARSVGDRGLGNDIFPGTSAGSELAAAIASLSANRIGALIGVEQGVSLEQYAKSGVLLEARLSSALVVSIFYPGSPLHDGAVIVRKDRILAAGCLLPLSADRLIEGVGLGARHQAALQLSSGTDAIVLVISENTGRISFATGGRLFREPVQSYELRS